MKDLHENYMLQLKAVAKTNELNKPVVFDALAAAGLTRITVEFDGEDDSGQIDDVTAYAGELPTEFPSTSLTLQRATQNASDSRTAKVPLRDAIETLCYDYLEQYHDRWEKNDGAYGTFEFDVQNRIIRLDFHERFIDVNTSCHDF